MRSSRGSVLAVLALATLALGAAVPAGAAPVTVAAPAASAAVRSVRPPLWSLAGYAGRRPGGVSEPAEAGTYSELSGDSCVPLSNPANPFQCEAVGFFWNPPVYTGLTEFSQHSSWYQDEFMPSPPQQNEVTSPWEVSCAAVPIGLNNCLLVGVHYNFGHTNEQLAAWGNADYFTIVGWRNPPGTVWSALDDVSCPSGNFCVAVGLAGHTKNVSSATWYTWNGYQLRQIHIPEPRHNRNSDLSGVSCFSTTDCLAVGINETRAGDYQPYGETWNGSTWHVTLAQRIRGQKDAFFQDDSCPTATMCMAVGNSGRPGTHQFAELWNGRKWTLSPLPRLGDSALSGVSCPSATSCFASGFNGNKVLLESWNGSRWTIMKTPRLSGREGAGTLQSISCISATTCVAVGLRYDPKVSYSERPLAERWNGANWIVEYPLNN